MKIVQALTAVVIAIPLAGFVGAGSNSDVIPGAKDTFPTVTGINLLGDEVRLPGGFEGDLNLVVIGFVQEHQKDIDTWIAALPDLEVARPSLRLYEVPVIYRASAPFRLWVNNGMHYGIPDPVARKRTITVYTDQKKFVESVGVTGFDRIHALLVDNSGRIIWRGQGGANPESLSALKSKLKSSE
jgi:hypothetical protein